MFEGKERKRGIFRTAIVNYNAGRQSRNFFSTFCYKFPVEGHRQCPRPTRHVPRIARISFLPLSLGLYYTLFVEETAQEAGRDATVFHLFALINGVFIGCRCAAEK